MSEQVSWEVSEHESSMTKYQIPMTNTQAPNPKYQ